MNLHSLSRRSSPVSVAALAAAALTIAAACSASPPIQQEPVPAADGAGAPPRASSPDPDHWLQFDNGSYNLRKADKLVGTMFVKTVNTVQKEIWVLSTASGDISCDTNGCNVANVEIERKSTTEDDCAKWKSYAEDIVGTRTVYAATYAEGTVRCSLGVSCTVSTPTASKSMLATGKYTAPTESLYSGVYVDASRNEYWLQTASVGGAGTTIVARSNDTSTTLQAFSCDMCTRLGIANDTSLKLRGVTYTLQSNGIDCTGL